MQKQDSPTLVIEHLLVELAWCIDDLHGFRHQLSIEDALNAETSFQKLEALISSAKTRIGTLRLIVS
ncbi:hypothetical protein [Legionella erythra]|uniref:Uncharacterized protein n=1 Tax=Legionella erythra TaxID=448 RepID=A0A0W0TGJ1_LEGER|nr:hypothetical protein [Legionella erythra]KTC94706.1 hypothetical protein Lery_2873 [Legionella erythra]